MLTWNTGPSGNSLSNARTFTLPTTDPLMSPTQVAVPAAATFQLRQRDTLDFSIDLTAWLAANAPGAVLTDATWAVPVGSPAAPSIVGHEFDPSGFAVVVINDNGAPISAVFWLDLTASISAAPLPSAPNLAVPARSITRRIYIQVVAG